MERPKRKLILRTKKQTARLENSISRKNNRQSLDQYVSEYSKMANETQLIEESKKILSELHKDSRDDELELKYDALISVMEEKIKDSYKYDYKFVGYPDYEDPEFNKKIASKKEFYINKIPKRNVLTPKEKNEMSKKLCDPSYSSKKEDITFNLTHNQKFLKTFLSPNTPYNSILLYHGTGVGKTCTSISIAEQYSDEIKA